MPKSTIRLSLKSNEILLSLEILEALGVSTENRSYSSCLEQLVGILLSSEAKHRNLSFKEMEDAKEELKRRKNPGKIDPTFQLSKEDYVEKMSKLFPAHKNLVGQTLEESFDELSETNLKQLFKNE